MLLIVKVYTSVYLYIYLQIL